MRVLILGSGTGTRLLEMAEKYTESTFIGLDDSSDYPGDESSHLQNAGFKRYDFLCGIPFHNSAFDLVLDFVDRSNLSGFQNDNLFSEVVRVLKPDGFLKKMEDEK
ncbi:17861_t:CDS:1 [Funneliformis geosporum]|nr:17861_t:CDS:1 [Funneliformis geosporum]